MCVEYVFFEFYLYESVGEWFEVYVVVFFGDKGILEFFGMCFFVKFVEYGFEFMFFELFFGWDIVFLDEFVNFFVYGLCFCGDFEIDYGDFLFLSFVGMGGVVMGVF